MRSGYDTSSPVSTTTPPLPLPSVSPQNQPLSYGSESLAQRMQNSTCFKCFNIGHWATNCPNKTPNKSQPSLGSDLPVIQCPCGVGACLVRTSRTEKNPGKRFYCCPGRDKKEGSNCSFFKWCEEVTAPRCPCGAGACSINTETKGPDAGRKYYACRITKGHGACPFFAWVDSQADTLTIQLGDESKFPGRPQSMPNSNCIVDTANIFSGMGDDMNNENVEMMEVEPPAVDNYQQFPNFEESDISSPENCDRLGILTLENENSVLEDELRSWDPLKRKSLPVSRLMSQSDIHRRQTEFWRQISAAVDTSTIDDINEMFSIHVMGWWSRLVFTPSRCLPPKSFRRDVGSSSTHLLHNSSHAEPDIPPPQASDKEAQPSSVPLGASGLKNPPYTVPENRILEAYAQALLISLKSMNPLDHVTMSKVASATYSLLDGLSIDYSSVSSRVDNFICCASRLAKIESSTCNDLSSQELMEQYSIEKVRFDDVSLIHADAVDAFTASNQKVQSLRQEASRMRSMLLEIENQITISVNENSVLKTHVAEISDRLSESTTNMQAVSDALKLSKQREEERSAAKAALEKARSELRLVM